MCVDHGLVEQPLVALLQRRQQHVAIDVARQPLQVRHHPLPPSADRVATRCGSSPRRPRRSRSRRPNAIDRLSVLSRRTSKPRFICPLVRIACTMATTTGPQIGEQDVADGVRHRVGQRADVAAARLAQRVQARRAGLRAGQAAERHQRAHLQHVARGDGARPPAARPSRSCRRGRCWRSTRRRSSDRPRRRAARRAGRRRAMNTIRPMSISNRCAGSGMAPNTG